MKLIVDIPKKLIEKDFYTEKDKWSIIDAVQNGTPLDNLTDDLEALREETEPHLVDYRSHRNDMLDMVLAVIESHMKEGE